MVSFAIFVAILLGTLSLSTKPASANEAVATFIFNTVQDLIAAKNLPEAVENTIYKQVKNKVIELSKEPDSNTALPIVADLIEEYLTWERPVSTPDPVPEATKPDPVPVPDPTPAPVPEPSKTDPVEHNAPTTKIDVNTNISSFGLDKLVDNSAEDLLRRINVERTRAWLVALKFDPKLFVMSQIQVRYMVETEHYSHIQANGNWPVERADQAWYADWIFIWENLAWGQKSNEKVMADWMASPGHRANILNPDFKEFWIFEHNSIWATCFGDQFTY